MNGPFAVAPGAQISRHVFPSFLLVGEERVAARRRDRNPEQARSGGRGFLKTPIRMPSLGEDRRGLIRHALDRDDMITPFDRGDVGVMSKRPEIEREAFQIIVA